MEETRGNLLIYEEVAEMFHVAVPTIRRWIRDRQFPCIRISHRCVRFDHNLVMQWAERQGGPPE